MAREITFPKTGDIWINAETGIWIERSFHEGSFGYIVRVPAWVGQLSYTTAAVKSYLKDARAAASDVAEGMRAQIARAKRDALLEYAVLMTKRAERAIDGAAAENAIDGELTDTLYAYLTSAKLFRETDPERSISWAEEILAQTDAAAERETEAAKVVTREEAHEAWGKLWAGSVPAGLAGAFYAGHYAEVLAMANEQIARQERQARVDQGREALARTWYAHAGYDVPLTSAEVSAGEADWDAGNAIETDRAESYRAADLVLSSEQAEVVSHVRSASWGLALLAVRDTFGLRSSSQRARRMLGSGRPAGWGAAWLEAQHPGQIDVVAEGGVGVATEPVAGRFFPGPM